ncbi:MAG: alpha/beta hydrolase [Rhizobacter sp.]|nr:alpha/beta hydrolase [Chlorobiales bacterium]
MSASVGGCSGDRTMVILKSPLGNNLKVHEHFSSCFLSPEHTLLVWLPPSYSDSSSDGLAARYPVLYMNDGQGLFESAVDFAPHTGWRLDTTALALVATNEIEPIIIVGICSEQRERDAEYTPTPVWWKHSGLAPQYAKMLAEEVKPFIDSAYRTLQSRENTGLGGASFGGLAALTAGFSYPNVFGKLAVLSPSVWWDGKIILEQVHPAAKTSRPRIWLSIGTGEGGWLTDWIINPVASARLLRDALTANGWQTGNDLFYLEAEGDAHTDQAWGKRMSAVLKTLFPKQSQHDR